MIGRWIRGGGVLLLAVVAAGCGRSTGNVSGTVKFLGKPLTAGTITFYDKDNRTASSAISPTGTYEVTQVGSGPVKVAVALPLAIPFAGPGGGDSLLTTPQGKGPAVPPRYFDPAQSGLGFEVVAGNQTHDFDLQP
jgi:hypothetical protein